MTIGCTVKQGYRGWRFLLRIRFTGAILRFPTAQYSTNIDLGMSKY
jgi:hypothetical protein